MPVSPEDLDIARWRFYGLPKGFGTRPSRAAMSTHRFRVPHAALACVTIVLTGLLIAACGSSGGTSTSVRTWALAAHAPRDAVSSTIDNRRIAVIVSACARAPSRELWRDLTEAASDSEGRIRRRQDDDESRPYPGRRFHIDRAVVNLDHPIDE